MSRCVLLLTAVVLASAGCAGDNSTPTAPETAQFGHGKPSVETDPAATWYLPVGDGTLAFRSDGSDQVTITLPGETTSSTYSRYGDGVCGVTGTIYATTSASNTADATLTTDQNGKKGCARTFTLAYPTGSESFRSFNNLRELQSSTFLIPAGQTVGALHDRTGLAGEQPFTVRSPALRTQRRPERPGRAGK